MTVLFPLRECKKCQCIRESAESANDNADRQTIGGEDNEKAKAEGDKTKKTDVTPNDAASDMKTRNTLWEPRGVNVDVKL